MKRHEALVPLSWDHHHGLVLALRIERELPGASDERLASLYSGIIAFWVRGLLPHFRVESECLLARLVSHIPEDDSRVRRLHDDHLGITNLVVRMRDTADSKERRALIGAFGVRLKEHIRWEESVLFTTVEETLQPDELDRLGLEIKEALPAVQPAPPLDPPG
jgi:hemerythrin-like domain-containing protein